MNPEALRLAAEDMLENHVNCAAIFDIHPDFVFLTESGVISGRGSKPQHSEKAQQPDAFLDTALKEAGTALMVAITDDRVHIIEWVDNSCGEEYISFTRNTIRVTVTKQGDDRTVHILDTENGLTFKLDGNPRDIFQEHALERTLLGLLR